ncbi:LOW QUALITY PROTEIN: protein NPAT [Rhinatrema bivittatum]|uniref:LOW QUALITY PROTEIN: protein NPAT n=1 Tax=Rhinatrema bivittatum TaxID=194408 RepID=UPI00112DBF55|nr:LOW QUALITY PROTEIN: protein NPAT [Rhinatrema bivittatum]
MLLPSDVARLVLGYLQQEKLMTTCQAFIMESSDLKEYAQHCTDDGFFPCCVLSLFGKNLTTILNEYVNIKARETQDVPAMMSSLWKKLDCTLSQIRSMQKNKVFSVHQRTRTRNGLANVRQQQAWEALTTYAISGLPPLSQNAEQQPPPPVPATQIIQRSASQARSNPLLFHQTSTSDSTPSSDISAGSYLHMSLPEPLDKRQHESLLSPGSRKVNTQKRRAMVPSSPHSDDQNIYCPSTYTVGESGTLQELRDGNFPEMVIENARETILSNKCLQEKLAENINKFLGSDTNATPLSKQADSTGTEPDSALNEILALEGGEIHMSEEAIHDILEQTESDPAFQALFDLFNYTGKSKNGKSAAQDCSSQHETEALSTTASEEAATSTLQPSVQTQDAAGPAESVLPAYSDLITSKSDCHKENTLQKNKTPVRCSSRIKLRKNTEKFQTAEPSLINEEQEKNSVFVSQPNLDESNQRQSLDSAMTIVSKEGSEMTMDTDEQLVSYPHVLGKSDLGPHPFAVLPHSQDSPGLPMEISNSGKSEQLISRGTPLAEICTSANELLREEPAEMPFSCKYDDCTNPSTDSTEKQQQKTSTEPATAVSLTQDFPDPVHHEGPSLFSVPSVGSPIAGILDGPRTSEEQHKVEDSSSGSLSDHGLLVLHKPISNTFNMNSDSAISDKITEIDVEAKEPICSKAKNIAHPALKNIEGCAQSNAALTLRSSHFASPLDNTNTNQGSSLLPDDIIISSSNSQAVEMDPNSIMSLKIVFRNEPSLSADTELNNAISSITGDGLHTIVLSSPSKTPMKNVTLSQCFSSKEAPYLAGSSERTSDSNASAQGALMLKPKDPTAANSVNFHTEEGAMFSLVSSPHFSKDGGFMQLMPATSAGFGQSNSIFITTCVPETPALDNSVTQSNVVMVPQQQLQTPPKLNSMFAASQTSPSYTQGSTIIIASPVQPLLQGMMGMIPVSVVGQNGNTLSAPPQIFHVPISAPVGNQSIPKLPIPPKSQKLVGARSISSGRKPANAVDSRSHQPGPRVQRSRKPEKSVTADQQQRSEESCLVTSDTINTNSKPGGSYRRVLCFDSSLSGEGSALAHIQTPSQSKGRKEMPVHILNTSGSASVTGKTPQSIDIGRPELERAPEAKSSSSPETVFTRIATSVTVRGAPEKRGTSADSLPDALYKATANKENEQRGDKEKQRIPEAIKLSTYIDKTVPSGPEVNRKQTSFPNILRRNYHEPKRGKNKFSDTSLCLASPLVKQAGDMLQKLQWHSPTAKQADNGDPPGLWTPGLGTGDGHHDVPDSTRTPTCRRIVEENGTPRALLPPATPEMPACSPASETSSENSVSMAAHTLMILSRAAIAKTNGTTPLKDNTQQPRSSRNTSRKRKLEGLNMYERDECPSSKKEVPSSTTPVKRKKAKKQKKKKVLDSFPAGMDVDKFLLSLHYDE